LEGVRARRRDKFRKVGILQAYPVAFSPNNAISREPTLGKSEASVLGKVDKKQA
jgi:hypothetical protein